MVKNRFSIIIPTYTGEETLPACLDSILGQESLEGCKDVIVVIDGPSKTLRKICEDYSTKFAETKVGLQIIQFHENKGRLKARYEGAKAATTMHLLFIDDRVTLGNRFLAGAVKKDKPLLMPSVKSNGATNVISLFLELLRKRLYKEEESEYYITYHNYERSAKGTTCLWVEKNIFIDACDEMIGSGNTTDLRNSSDDTKLLKILIRSGEGIFKSSLTVNYSPRTSFLDEFTHVYNRGPKFVDYYLHPKTRYFKSLVLFYVTLVLVTFILFLNWEYLPYLVYVVLLLWLLGSIYITRSLSNIVKVFIGMSVASCAFAAGLVKGLLIKIGR